VKFVGLGGIKAPDYMVSLVSPTNVGAADTATSRTLDQRYINDPEAGRARDDEDDKSRELQTVSDSTILEKDISNVASKNLDFPDGLAAQ
jgi:hypothetical protein